MLCTGRELVESEGNSTQTLPTESLDDKGFEGMVESGRELQGGKEEIIIEGEQADNNHCADGPQVCGVDYRMKLHNNGELEKWCPGKRDFCWKV